QLLAGELRGCTQISRVAPSVRREELGRKRVQVRLVAGRDLQHGGFDLDEIPRREIIAHRGGDASAREQQRPAIGVGIGVPEGPCARHGFAQTARRGPENRWNSRGGSLWCAPESASRPRPGVRHEETSPVKVIASSLRRGKLVDISGKLYVILSAENIHPGKGTPV